MIIKVAAISGVLMMRAGTGLNPLIGMVSSGPHGRPIREVLLFAPFYKLETRLRTMK